MTLANQDLFLRCRPPQSKEELFWYCKEQLRVICEACKGAGTYWKGRENITCPWCQGQGTHGFHIARKAVCPGHSAPLDALWEIYSGEARQQMWIATRGGGKTRAVAILEHLKARFQRFTIQHMGAIEQQALRCREWLRQQTAGIPGTPFVYDAESKEPIVPGISVAVDELLSDAQEKVTWNNGALIEFLPGTMAQASGPHNEGSVLDEVDEADPEVQQKFSKTPTGPRAFFLMTSTHTYATGTVSRIRRDQPLLPVKVWCIFESLQQCTHDCDKVPLPDGSKGRCPLFEEEIVTADGRREIHPLCAGILARKSDGHIPLEQALLVWLSSDPYTRGVELLCRNPELGLGAGRAYWAFSPENVLPFDPPVADAPLEWSLDFNPGVGMEMCSVVIQQAPPEYPNEWWIIDEIVLPTSSTPATVSEFLRRYGPPSEHNNFNGGILLPPDRKQRGHWHGVWVYGDATGTARQSTTGETDYEVVTKLMNHLNDFKCIVQSGDSNPPLVDRLNRTNELLWDPLSKRRTLKIAPRCQRLRDELTRMPLKPGTREKDKSMKLQKLGLSHLGDGVEYWVYLRFPAGIRGAVADLFSLLGRKRDAAGVLLSGGRRASGGEIAVMGSGFSLTEPWNITRDPRGY